MSEVTPTSPQHELEKGRVALWLDPADLRWLAENCRGADDASDEELERWARLRFRTNAALHKVGLRGD